MTDQHLPPAEIPKVDFELEQFGGQPEASSSHNSLTMEIGQKGQATGQFSWGGVNLGDSVLVVFLSRHMHRTLFAMDYDDAIKSGSKNLVVCKAPDGEKGFGVGRKMARTGQFNYTEMKEHDCRACPAAEWPRGSRKPPQCPPQWRYYVFFKHPDREEWYPAFIQVKGITVRGFQTYYDKLTRQCSFRGIKPHDVMCYLTLRKNPKGGDGIVIEDPKPTMVREMDRTALHSALSAMAKATWDAEIDWCKGEMDGWKSQCAEKLVDEAKTRKQGEAAGVDHRPQTAVASEGTPGEVEEPFSDDIQPGPQDFAKPNDEEQPDFGDIPF